MTEDASLELDQFMRRVHDQFNLSLKMRKAISTLDSLSFRLTLMVKNGVVRAAKIQGAKGAPLMTIGAFLSEFPTRLGPQLALLQGCSNDLAQHTTVASNLVKRYFLLENSLRSDAFGREHETTERTATQGANHGVITKNCKGLLGELSEALRAILESLSAVGRPLADIQRVAMTAQILALSISIEAARLDTEGAPFKTLANQINELMVEVDQTLTSLGEDLSTCPAETRCILEAIA